jgi:hypothetical protein
MLTYNPYSGRATGITNGRGVPRCHLSKRLDLAAAAVLGWAPLQPSITQAVRDFNVPHAALKQRIERFRALEANGNGQAPVAVAPVVEAANTEETSDATIDTLKVTVTEKDGYADGYARVLAEALAERMQAATPMELHVVAETLGAARIWDTMIEPLLEKGVNGNGR